MTISYIEKLTSGIWHCDYHSESGYVFSVEGTVAYDDGTRKPDSIILFVPLGRSNYVRVCNSLKPDYAKHHIKYTSDIPMTNDMIKTFLSEIQGLTWDRNFKLEINPNLL